MSTFPFALNITFPPKAVAFFRAMSFVNFSALSVGSPQCYTTFDYKSKLLLVTISPLAIFAAMGLVYFFHRRHYVHLQKTDSKYNPETLISRYVGMVLVITYLVLPSVSTTIFGSFTTTNIDPEGLVPGLPRYLRNDLTIADNSATFYFCQIYAGIMIAVYPFGIPMLYLYLLLSAQKHIQAGKKPQGAFKLPPKKEDRLDKLASELATSVRAPEEDGDKTAPLTWRNELGFLHRAYERDYFYWEVVETLRRLLLTAVVSVVSTGSSLQIIFGIFVAVAFMKLYAFFQPFELDRHDTLQEVAQYQVFFTLFISLLIRSSALPGYDSALESALIVANLITPVATIFVHVDENDWKATGENLVRFFSCAKPAEAPKFSHEEYVLVISTTKANKGKGEGKEEMKVWKITRKEVHDGGSDGPPHDDTSRSKDTPTQSSKPTVSARTQTSASNNNTGW